MECVIILLYFGFVVVAFLSYVQFKSAKILHLQGFVPGTLVATLIITFLIYRMLQTTVLYDDNEALVFLFCLLFPFVATFLGVIAYFLLNIQPVPQRTRWLGFATLSLQTLIASPILLLFLPYERGNSFSVLNHLFDQYRVVGWLYGGIIVMMMAVTASLSRQPPLKIKQYSGVAFGLGILSIALWVWFARHDIYLVGELVFPLFFSIPYGVVGLFMLLDLHRFSGERVTLGIVAFIASLSFIWSPYLGNTTGKHLCNAIHQWQLAPVIDGVRRYEQDSARYPLGVQALVPYYLDAPPDLLCFGPAENLYSFNQCNGELLILLQNHSTSSFLYNIDDGQWIEYPFNKMECTQFNP